MDTSGIDGAFEEGNVWRRIRRIVPAFVKCNVPGMFDFTSEVVEVISVLERTLETEEDAGACVHIDLCVAFIGRKSINTATENAEM